MALDRQSIQRTDFPLARKGYEPAAVDAHLRAIADEVATVEAAPKAGDTLASSASDHVRTIIEAAETSADKIRREAQDSASAMREQARQHAQELSVSTAAMLERLEATERELESVIESLRAQAGGLEAGAASEAEAAPEAVTAFGPELASAEEPAGAAPEPVGVQSNADAEGARLIALHMALNGTPRDETAKYLSEHYRLADRDQLLDEVYASVQG